jgi:hypothetical protein
VDEQDQPYPVVVERMTQVNPEIWSWLEVPREGR